MSAAIQPVISPLIDDQNPWPGLAPFDEAAERFFNGRRRETAELARLVASGHLTVLFGASGLGKTSLVQAGLFPQLRRSHILPLYIRLAITGRGAPLIDQVRAAFVRELQSQRIEAAAFRPDESLWEYLHRDELELWSRQNQLLTPLFVFDQFEEVLTLGASNAQGVAQLRIDLADLVENRMPASLAGRGNDRLALDSRRYKVLLSFREDYLAAFESWKRDLPSIMRNRYGLARMNPAQALDAVLLPGGHIITAPVAEEVVRFVACANEEGQNEDSELDSLQVEPALLSVVCRELNTRRLRQGRATISSDDLKAARGNILSDFYERSFAGMPGAARTFVEDRLLTLSGFRNTAPEDEAEAAGLSQTVIGQLVERRLIRREIRLGVSHVELTHDLLTKVVRASRDARREQAVRSAEEQQRAATERRRRGKVLRIVLGTAGTLVVVLAVLAILSARQANISQRLAERNEARSHVWRADAVRQRMHAEAAAAKASLAADEALLAEGNAERARLKAEEEVGVTKAALAAARFRAGIEFGYSQVQAGPSGRLIVTVGLDGRARLVEGDAAKPSLRSLADPGAVIKLAAISPSEKEVATVSSSGDVKIWSVSTGRVVSSFRSDRHVSSISFAAASSAQLLLAFNDGTVEVVDGATGKLQRTLKAAAAGGCVPFRAVILDYSPRPGYKVTFGLEAQCLADRSPSAAATAQNGLNAAQMAQALEPAVNARNIGSISREHEQAQREVEAVLAKRDETSPPSPTPGPAPPPAAAVQPRALAPAARESEEWRMHFTIRNGTGDPLLTFEMTVDHGRGSAKSSSIVRNGLDERQLRAVAAEIESLMHKLPADVGKGHRTTVPPNIIAAANQTAKAIAKALGLVN